MDSRYGFAIGRIRCREALLFDQNRYEQLIACENEEDFLRILLGQSPYAEFQKTTVDELLNDAGVENFWFFKKYCLDLPVLNLILHREDLHNLKLILKAKLSSQPLPEMLSPFGSIPPTCLSEISQGFISNDLDSLNKLLTKEFPDSIRKGLSEAKIAYEATKAPEVIDYTLDKAVMNYSLELAKISEFLFTYYQYQIDLENIRTMLRVRFFQIPVSVFNEAYIPQGTIKSNYFTEQFAGPLEMILERFALTQYRAVIVEGVNYLINNHSFTRFERLATEFLLSYLRRARFFTFGFEPLFSYFLMKENEIKNLRKIHQGIKMKISQAEKRESITYA